MRKHSHVPSYLSTSPVSTWSPFPIQHIPENQIISFSTSLQTFAGITDVGKLGQKGKATKGVIQGGAWDPPEISLKGQREPAALLACGIHPHTLALLWSALPGVTCFDYCIPWAPLGSCGVPMSWISQQPFSKDLAQTFVGSPAIHGAPRQALQRLPRTQHVGFALVGPAIRGACPMLFPRRDRVGCLLAALPWQRKHCTSFL